MLYSYKWGSEKFKPFFEFPIQLASIPAPFYKHIFLRNNSINSSNNQEDLEQDINHLKLL